MTWNTNRDPSDPQDLVSKETMVPVEDAAAGGRVAAPDAPAQPKDDLEAAKAESEQWRDRFLRKAAELENFRKRSERERTESATLTKISLLAEFLPIMDACERALKSFKEEENQDGRLKKYREGVDLLYKQLGDTLSRLGVVALKTKGRRFDPHLHEALMHQETMDYEDNTVIEELRRGYLLNERLLRPAQVVVAHSLKRENDKGLAQL